MIWELVSLNSNKRLISVMSFSSKLCNISHFQEHVYFCMPVFWVSDQIKDQISRSVVSDSLPPHEPQHARPPCPSPTPGVHSDSCASSQWCHPAISSSVVPFSSCPQSLPASESFPMSHTLAVLKLLCACVGRCWDRWCSSLVID